MSEIIESLVVIGDEGCLLEATLSGNGEVVIHAEDDEAGVDLRYDLDQIRTIVATLGHLLYVADNHEDDQDD